VISAYYVWVNGHSVGYSEDSRLPAEFNITKYLRPGENTLAVEVYRFSDGSYLEDQDFWRLSGIFRDVELVSRSPVHVRDFYVRTDFDADYRDASLKRRVKIRNSNRVEGLSLEAKLFDGSSKLVGRPLAKDLLVSGNGESQIDLARL